MKEFDYGWLGDIEANGLHFDITKIWMIRLIKVDDEGFMVHYQTGEPLSCATEKSLEANHDDAVAVEFYLESEWEIHKEEILATKTSGTKCYPLRAFKKFIKLVTTLMGHNFINYDVEILSKIMGLDYYETFNLDDHAKQVIDTLIMSRTLHCDRRPIKAPKGQKAVKGIHGLAPWGHRLGIPKPEHDDWLNFSMEMVFRMREDCKINLMLFPVLLEEMQMDLDNDGIDWKPILELEHLASKVMVKSELVGMPFDKEFAESFRDQLDNCIEEIDKEVMPQLPLRLTEEGSKKLNNGDYVDMMQDVLGNELIDLGYFREVAVLGSDGEQSTDSKGVPKFKKLPDWPIEWDFMYDDDNAQKPTLLPFSDNFEVTALVRKYWDKCGTEATKEVCTLEYHNIHHPVLDDTYVQWGDPRILKAYRKLAKSLKEEGITESSSKAKVFKKMYNEDPFSPCNNIVKSTGEVKISKKGDPLNVPSWLKTSYVIGPYRQWRAPIEDLIIGPYTKVKSQVYNLGSDSQVKRLLLTHYSWMPDEWTEKGSPKLTESSFERSLNTGIGASIKERMVHKARRSMVQNVNKSDKGWLNRMREVSPGNFVISQFNNPQGAATTRSTHANVVNVPSVGALWGYHSRRCFIAPKMPKLLEGYTWSYDASFETKEAMLERMKMNEKLIESFTYEEVNGKWIATSNVKGRYAYVGCDAAGLEMRMLAHEMGDAEITAEIIDGDFHTIIWKLFDEYVATRGDTKTFEYAMIYGGGDEKLGSIATLNRDRFDEDVLEDGGWIRTGDKWRMYNWPDRYEDVNFLQAQNREIGAKLRKLVMGGLKPLGDAVEKVTEESRKGWITAIDGRKLRIRGEHAALNMKLQSTGAIVMKRATVEFGRGLQDMRNNYEGFYGELTSFYHDEISCICSPEYRVEVGELYRQCIIKAGEYYNLSCPLEADPQYGLSWLDVH